MKFQSFLEYVCFRLLGPPIVGTCWQCPFCDSSSACLSVRPPKGSHPVKFKCFRCDQWGDELDLQRHFPGRVRLAQWRKDFERDRDTLTIPHRGSGPTGKAKSHENDPRNVSLVWANLMETLRNDETSDAFALQILVDVLTECEAHNVSIYALIEYWQQPVEWQRVNRVRQRQSNNTRHLDGYDWTEADNAAMETWKPPVFFLLSEDLQDKILLDAAKQANRDLTRERN